MLASLKNYHFAELPERTDQSDTAERNGEKVYTKKVIEFEETTVFQPKIND